MRILIIGAGVTGSLFTSYLVNGKKKLEKRFKENVEINLLSRGETFSRIRDHGLKIHHVQQNITTIDKVPVIKKLESGDAYDYVLIFLRKTQVRSLLSDLSYNKSEYFVFFGNNGTGTEELKEYISPGKIALGFAGVGGRREGDTVFSVHSRKPDITFGAATEDKKKRMRRLRKVFNLCGISPSLTGKMDSWLKYHLALVIPLARAVYRDGGDNVSLSQNTELLKMAIRAIRESFEALISLKYPVRPIKLRFMMLTPDPLIRRKLSRLLASDLGRLLVFDHCMAAPEEMQELYEELLVITGKSEKSLNDLTELG